MLISLAMRIGTILAIDLSSVTRPLSGNLKHEAPMDWIEAILLRSYTPQDRDAAVAAFQQISSPGQETGLREIVLLRDVALDNDLCICIHWHGEVPRKGKSSLGLQLASCFSEFGQISHSVWVNEGRVPFKASSNRGGV
jgi:hypothetical protein